MHGAVYAHPASDGSNLDMVMHQAFVVAELCSHVEQLGRKRSETKDQVSMLHAGLWEKEKGKGGGAIRQAVHDGRQQESVQK